VHLLEQRRLARVARIGEQGDEVRRASASRQAARVDRDALGDAAPWCGRRREA
jgi:hypothetical protein